MLKLTPEQKKEATELWKKKVSTIEYHALELCVNLIDGYQKGLEKSETYLNDKIVPLPDHHELSYQAALNSIYTLQLLLGIECLTRDCHYPLTLEVALQEAGLNEEIISIEKKRCEEYLTKAEQLMHKSEVLGERGVKITYEVLTAKQMKGETLTSEEKESLGDAISHLSIDH